MAVFVTNLKRLRLVMEHERDDILNGIVVRHASRVIEFGNEGKYTTDDKSEIKELREHRANSHNSKKTSSMFWELNFKEEDYNTKPIKEMAKVQS